MDMEISGVRVGVETDLCQDGKDELVPTLKGPKSSSVLMTVSCVRSDENIMISDIRKNISGEEEEGKKTYSTESKS